MKLFLGVISFLIKFFLVLPLMLLGFIVVPIALLFAKDNHLPVWAEWCWGNKEHGNNGGNFWIKRSLNWPNYLRCFWWLVVRNPTANWSKHVLGIAVTKPIVVEGNVNVDEDDGISGYYFATGQRWEYKYISKPYSLFNRDWCVKLRFGWKITGKDYGELATFCFTPNPICPFTKR